MISDFSIINKKNTIFTGTMFPYEIIVDIFVPISVFYLISARSRAPAEQNPKEFFFEISSH